MKTPIQELIDTFKEMNTGIDPTVDVRFVLGLLRSKLEKEYNFIEQVYYDARDNEYEHHFLINKKVPLDFSEYLKQKQNA